MYLKFAASFRPRYSFLGRALSTSGFDAKSASLLKYVVSKARIGELPAAAHVGVLL